MKPLVEECKKQNYVVGIKTPEEAKATVAEWYLIDRGFLIGPVIVGVVLAMVAAIVLSIGPLLALGAGILLADFVVFCVRRVRTLRRYEAGTPRLATSTDLASVSKAFQEAGVPEPNMSDWENAAGHAGHAPWRIDLRYKELLKYYRGGLIADVGCGDGRLCWRYKICPAEDYIGIDVAEDLLRQLRVRTGNRVKTIIGTAENTMLPDSSVDFVACTEVFEHLPRPALAIREFSRILRPAGTVVIQSPNAARLRNLNPLHAISCVAGVLFPSLLMRKVVHENTFIRAYTYHWDFTRQDIRSCLKNSGLSLQLLTTSTYRFNPEGSLVHRIAYWIARLPLVSWAWSDMTVVLEKKASQAAPLNKRCVRTKLPQ